MLENMIMVLFWVFVKLMEFLFIFFVLTLHPKMEKPNEKFVPLIISFELY